MNNTIRERIRHAATDTLAPLLVSDTTIDAIYAEENSDEDLTIVRVIERMIGTLMPRCETEADEKRLERLEKWLAHWEKRAGVTGSPVFFDTLDMGLDVEESELSDGS